MNYYTITGKRFVRRNSSAIPTPATGTAGEASAVFNGLQGSAQWREVSDPNIRGTLPVTGGEQTDGNLASLDFFDAYSFCANHRDGQHKLYMGAAAYRFEFPAAFAGASLKSITLPLFGDPFLGDGARVVVAASASPDPEALWSAVTQGEAMLSGSNKRTETSAATPSCPQCVTWKAFNANYTLNQDEIKSDGSAATFPAGGLTLQRYLFVYLSLENYRHVRNGWVEGSAMTAGAFPISVEGAGLPPDGALPDGGGTGEGGRVFLRDLGAVPFLPVNEQHCSDNELPPGTTLVFNRVLSVFRLGEPTSGANARPYTSTGINRARELFNALSVWHGSSKKVGDPSHVRPGNTGVGVSGILTGKRNPPNPQIRDGLSAMWIHMSPTTVNTNTAVNDIRYETSFATASLPPGRTFRRIVLAPNPTATDGSPIPNPSNVTVSFGDAQLTAWHLPQAALQDRFTDTLIRDSYALTRSFWRGDVTAIGDLARLAKPLPLPMGTYDGEIVIESDGPFGGGGVIVIAPLVTALNQSTVINQAFAGFGTYFGRQGELTASPKIDLGTPPNNDPESRWWALDSPLPDVSAVWSGWCPIIYAE